MALFVLLEVMDKEPTIGVVWLTFLLVGAEDQGRGMRDGGREGMS